MNLVIYGLGLAFVSILVTIVVGLIIYDIACLLMECDSE